MDGLRPVTRRLYELLTDEEASACRDIPETLCEQQPANFFKHVISLAFTKTGDGLADPKLVLTWLLTAVGAPAMLIGFLVPVREAGALLPQLFTSGYLRRRPLRKWFWAAGSLVQGFCVVGMGLAVLKFEGRTAGWWVVGLLAVFALARSICSASYKDVLGKTIVKAARGTVTGSAGSIAAGAVLLFGLAVSVGWLPTAVPVIATVTMLGGGLWILAAVLFATLAEAPGATEGDVNAIRLVIQQFSFLRDDPQLVFFILTRGMLIATALAPPYLLSMAGEVSGRELGRLGPFVLAASFAGLISSFIWGRLADRSSRKVLMLAGVIGALVLAVTGGIGLWAPHWMAIPILMPALLFVLMIAYQGVRLGRSTHIVDMTGESRRASYTALSNTIIGLLLILGSLFGLVATAYGEAVLLLVFAGMCVLATIVGAMLKEVQQD